MAETEELMDGCMAGWLAKRWAVTGGRDVARTVRSDAVVAVLFYELRTRRVIRNFSIVCPVFFRFSPAMFSSFFFARYVCLSDSWALFICQTYSHIAQYIATYM